MALAEWLDTRDGMPRSGAGELPPHLAWARTDLEPHLAPYGGVDGVYWGDPRPAPSIAWRSEQQLLEAMQGAETARGTMNRFVTRAWICEKRHGEDGSAQAGDSLGFIHIRPRELGATFSSSPNKYRLALLEAYLEPPAYMSRPEYHVIRTRAARPYGEERLRCTPYFQPLTELDVAVASCGVANVFCAASLVTPMWGGICQGPFDLVVAAASSEAWGDVVEFEAPGQTGDVGDNEVAGFADVLNRGISPECMLGMLRSEYIGLGAAYETSGAGRLDADARDVTWLLCEYLSLGAPCIVWVDEHHLLGTRTDPPGARGPVRSGEAHSILIVGYHSNAGTADRFVFHDTLKGPFREVDASRLVDAAMREMQLDDGQTAQAACRFVAILPGGVSTPISLVLRASHALPERLQIDDEQHMEPETTDGGDVHGTASGRHRSVRLCSKHQLPTRYGHADLDDQRTIAAALNEAAVQCATNWWWCVECSGSPDADVVSRQMIVRPRPDGVEMYATSLPELRRTDWLPAVIVNRRSDDDRLEVRVLRDDCRTYEPLEG